MSAPDPTASPSLPRVLGLRDVVLLYATAIVSIQWVSTAAQLGPASVPLWALALVVFFIPSGLAVMELASRYDGEGGLYVWVKSAFGDVHGFVAGWAYVVSTLVYFPTLLLFIAGAVARVAGMAWPVLNDSRLFSAAVALLVVWLVIGVNIIGLRHAARITNTCAINMGGVLVILVAGSLACAARFGSATAFAGQWRPDLADPQLFKSFTTMMFALVGLELAPLMGSEIRDPQRVIPRAIPIAGGLIMAFYVLGTTALLVALPKEQIASITGIAEAVLVVTERLGWPGLGAPVVLLMAVGSVGVLAAWVAGIVRVPYVVGIDQHLPAALGRLHPRWRSPHVALLSVGGITTALLLLALAGTSVGDAYQVLVDMTVALTFIPIAYMFLALPVLRWRHVGDRPGLHRVPGGFAGLALVSGLGFVSTLAAIVCAFVPPATGDALIFYAKLLGGCVLFLGLGLTLYVSTPHPDKTDAVGTRSEPDTCPALRVPRIRRLRLISNKGT